MSGPAPQTGLDIRLTGPVIVALTALVAVSQLGGPDWAGLVDQARWAAFRVSEEGMDQASIPTPCPLTCATC